ncbi:hypothetical protein [Mycobacteroides salmoniphilum]|uniref:Uncharacterized protein n=1 Tax=Mycobacteroides salmoniphilum TaxID=404941 RepID=A0A4R8SC20_9MYCO|nr:hypothetical protein [Mycobacteroides salmoniphilum]TDZ92101.1 hypothetical protein CCUG60885_04215 [Mycobacteroides salmoniphilum]TEA07331.1 hypothetical protein CCUG60883_01364 [Mycobacteroides salmoniphilum]
MKGQPINYEAFSQEVEHFRGYNKSDETIAHDLHMSMDAFYKRLKRAKEHTA